MRPSEVERWATRVVDSIDRGRRGEDDRVELKRRPKRTALENARRIAGHANQVREGRLLWIFGIDEDGTRHALPDELADPAQWWGPIEALFDDVAPSPSFVHLDEDRLLAVGFDTERVPFIVNHSNQTVSREIPWREGTRVRSATRYDVIRLLLPTSELPQISILRGELKVTAWQVPQQSDERYLYTWSLDVGLYAEATAGFVLPDHLLRVAARIPAHDPPFEFNAWATSHQPTSPYQAAVRHAERGDDQLIVSGSAAFAVHGARETESFPHEIAANSGSLRIRLGFSADRALILTPSLSPDPPSDLPNTDRSSETFLVGRWSVDPEPVPT